MIARCKTNEAFEDTLTTAEAYPILALRNGSVLIQNDKGQERWYGLARFGLEPTARPLSDAA